MAQSIDDIRNSRDAALAALDTSISAVGNQIAQTTTHGPIFGSADKAISRLYDERNAILAAATEAVLQLTERHRGGRYVEQSSQPDEHGRSSATHGHQRTDRKRLGFVLAQQFADTLATARKLSDRNRK